MCPLCKGSKIITFFKAICDSNRHSILHLIKKGGEMNATDIISKMNLSQPTVSHHLKILVDAGVIESRKDGKETFYRINEKFISHCCHGFSSEFCSGKTRK